MHVPEYAVLSRECRAVQIPEGTPSLLSPGTRVRITQALGGSYTVVTERGHMLRIDARDADAIGKTPADGLADLEEASLEDQVWTRLQDLLTTRRSPSTSSTWGWSTTAR